MYFQRSEKSSAIVRILLPDLGSVHGDPPIMLACDSHHLLRAPKFLSFPTMVLAYLSGHRSACKYKQKERESKLAALPSVYHEPLTGADKSILSTPLSHLVGNIKKGEIKPLDVLRAYGKEAIRVHAQTNCLTEIMIGDAERWAAAPDLKGPLVGIPGTTIWG
jgi:hypothetical protein